MWHNAHGRTAALLLGLLLPGALAAQVGHDPLHSPYRTLRYSQFISFSSGLLNGNGGSLGVAPHHGPFGSLRYDFLSAGTLTVGLQASLAATERNVVDPTKPIATAVTGPVKQRVFIAEGIIQFNLTGGKTWHGIAPYLSTGIGLLLSKDTPAEVSDFQFHTRLSLAPALGARIFLQDRLFLRLEARSAFWSVTYPASFRAVPSTAPGEPPVLATPRKEWLANGWYVIGIGYAFSRPF